MCSRVKTPSLNFVCPMFIDVCQCKGFFCVCFGVLAYAKKLLFICLNMGGRWFKVDSVYDHRDSAVIYILEVYALCIK